MATEKKPLTLKQKQTKYRALQYTTFVGKYLALDIVDAWLNTDFEAERHLRRVNLIE